MAPNRILPVVGIFVLLNDKLLVNLHAETRQLRQFHAAVRELEVILVGHVIEDRLSDIVVDADGTIW